MRTGVIRTKILTNLLSWPIGGEPCHLDEAIGVFLQAYAYLATRVHEGQHVAGACLYCG